ncbi:hypothetical protein [Shewanella youngdeokensis]|uniref:Uncharacterized protein n=1 Tax=Shewanella youngdeokensis TaxID=2999068 RepID=A0ABZ0K0H7_9GAMM|nr:hypothetical protein RGE70_03525 [Shewanella sp. DAU334]
MQCVINIGVINAALLLICYSLSAIAGQVVVRKSSEPFDAFAVRNQVLADFEWQASLQLQDQINILQALPLGCLPMMTPYPYFNCHGHFYRPLVHEEKQLYIQIDQPAVTKLEK